MCALSFGDELGEGGGDLREHAVEVVLYRRQPDAIPELVEAAARSGNRELAADALARLTERTRVAGTEWALGIEARSRALLSDGEIAEGLYREAIERLGRSRLVLELARAHLLYRSGDFSSGSLVFQRPRTENCRDQTPSLPATLPFPGSLAL